LATYLPIILTVVADAGKPMYPIDHARIDWQDDPLGEIPVSTQFGDVYFSRENGLLETRHVFLEGNELPTRLANLAPHQQFIVGETGFGTGLNFLALWQLWRDIRPDHHCHLHVVSVEKYPLSLADLTRALKAWPELSDLSAQLLAQYPPALAGVHRLIFAHERISLDVWLGDAVDCLPMIHSHRPFDAWFLDGFAPSCNPELWQRHILAHIIRLSGIGTTFASFSVAGILKQGLREHGITVTRPKGFGKKREMLKAWWPTPDHQQTAIVCTTHTQHIAVIGAGIAGLSIAYALARRGHRVSLIEKTTPLAGGSGNPRALLAPKFARISLVHENLHTIGWLATTRWWSTWSDQVIEPTGVICLSTDKMPIDLAKITGYPSDVCTPMMVDGQTALSIPRGGLLKPHALAQQVLAHPLIDVIHAEVTALWPDDQSWQLFDDEWIGTFDQVVLSNGKDCSALCPQLPQLASIRGQVSWATYDATMLPSQAYSYGGYCTPMQHDGHASLLFGASFVRQDDQTDLREADHLHNAELLNASLPAIAQALPPQHTWQGRAAIRAQTRDYLPIVGAVSHLDKVWVLAGLGSKGFCFAPICAELLCAQMLGECSPLPLHVIKQLDVMRASGWR
jgi:tRNA 5-methylaminomethyl-2-thiouridine biosynthesis bifunctional protein